MTQPTNNQSTGIWELNSIACMAAEGGLCYAFPSQNSPLMVVPLIASLKMGIEAGDEAALAFDQPTWEKVKEFAKAYLPEKLGQMVVINATVAGAVEFCKWVGFKPAVALLPVPLYSGLLGIMSCVSVGAAFGTFRAWYLKKSQ
ncbi:MAG: hypothetical protein JSS32_06915 [Verrucomicrobia bacterium]|nr:hypothetical protein [Verrucomicrobiota bacterium]